MSYAFLESKHNVYGSYLRCAIFLLGLLNFESVYMLSDACSKAAIQYQQSGGAEWNEKLVVIIDLHC